MPNVTVYIRRADLEKFKALPNKAEFISNALNEQPLQQLQSAAYAGGQIKTKEDVIPAIKKVFPDAKIEPLYRDKRNGRL